MSIHPDAPPPPEPANADVTRPRVRRAVPGDARALAEFAARAFHATYGPDADPSTGGGSAARDVTAYVDRHFGPVHQEAELADAAMLTLLAVAGRADRADLVGYAQLRLHAGGGGVPVEAGARPAELARLYVDGAWQGGGVGRALLDAVQEAADAAGATAVWLCAYERNAGALAFYRRLGFRAVGRATFRMGAEVQHDHVLVR